MSILGQLLDDGISHLIKEADDSVYFIKNEDILKPKDTTEALSNLYSDADIPNLSKKKNMKGILTLFKDKGNGLSLSTHKCSLDPAKCLAMAKDIRESDLIVIKNRFGHLSIYHINYIEEHLSFGRTALKLHVHQKIKGG